MSAPTPKPFIVGELNPYGPDADFAMYPLPERSAGGRLCSLILGMDRGAYLRSFKRFNLCTGKWSLPAARSAALGLEDAATAAGGAALILCGSKVCAGFGLDFAPFQSYPAGILFRSAIAILPHPSGLCRIWSSPGAYERARECVLGVAPHLETYVGRRSAA